MTYRKWKYEDILKISELEKECFSSPWSFRTFADAFAFEHFYGVLAEENGEIVGYACETVVCENAETDVVAVAENYRHHGIGNHLLKRLEDEAIRRGANNMTLEVRVSNAEAMKLYLKRGYCGIYTRSRYYPDGEDAVVMQKKL